VKKKLGLALTLPWFGIAGYYYFARPDVRAPFSPALLGKTGSAHACPVAGIVVTAAHVVSNEDETGFEHYIIEANGFTGPASGIAMDQRVDIGVLAVGVPVESFQIATELKVGEHVYWTEFNFEDVDRAWQPVMRDAEVVTLVGGHIFFAGEVHLGASGGCLFNSRSQVVGVVIAGDELANGHIGVAVNVVGFWVTHEPEVSLP